MHAASLRRTGEPLYLQLRNIFDFGRCTTLRREATESEGIAVVEVGDVVDPITT